MKKELFLVLLFLIPVLAFSQSSGGNKGKNIGFDIHSNARVNHPLLSNNNHPMMNARLHGKGRHHERREGREPRAGRRRLR
jgi:hypothetical protein